MIDYLERQNKEEKNLKNRFDYSHHLILRIVELLAILYACLEYSFKFFHGTFFELYRCTF